MANETITYTEALFGRSMSCGRSRSHQRNEAEDIGISAPLDLRDLWHSVSRPAYTTLGLLLYAWAVGFDWLCYVMLSQVYKTNIKML